MEKREVFWTAWSNQGQFDVLVNVDLGAVIPDGLSGIVKFTFGSALAKPIKNLKWDNNDGLSATLSFGGEPFDCVFPLSSIAAICAEDYMVSWPVKISSDEENKETVGERAKKAGLRIV